MGNSEVGHTNIGAGRVVFQDLPRISQAIQDGSFLKPRLLGGHSGLQENGSALHLMGLLSDGGSTATSPISLPCWSWPNVTVWSSSIFTSF